MIKSGEASCATVAIGQAPRMPVNCSGGLTTLVCSFREGQDRPDSDEPCVLVACTDQVDVRDGSQIHNDGDG
jgi:hypothetical protein